MQHFEGIFDNESDWKVHFEEKNIYIMKDHSWAFAIWEIEKIKGTITEDSVLLHVDDHLDDVPDGLYLEDILSANTKEELFDLTRHNKELFSGEQLESKIQIDNFIWPSFARGTIGTMFTVSPQDMPDFASVVLTEHEHHERNDGYISMQRILNLVPIDKFRNVYRTHSYEEFKEKHIEVFKRETLGKSKILDLDLDYFVPASQNGIIMPDSEIRRIIRDLLDLCQWNLITVALSPEYCGGEMNTSHLLKLFCETAGLIKNT